MGKVQLNSEIINYNDEWSFKNFSNMHVPVNQMPSDIVVYSSIFYHEEPDYSPFPEGMTGVTFVKCNLDNLIIPPGNTVIECSQKRFKAQNDLNFWEIDENNLPTVPIGGTKQWTKFGLSVPDPKDIPAEKVSEPVDLKKLVEAKLVVAVEE